VPAFFARRVLYGLISLVILSAIIFACTHLLPGDAAVTILGEGATPEALAALRVRLGLDDRSPSSTSTGWPASPAAPSATPPL
jgi:ABC-type dipeptide/oligopeptide/nickel transport systems, permease components